MSGVFARLVLFVVLVQGVSVCRALDRERLWLPKKYQHAMPSLVSAAELAEASPRCQEVVAGKMLQGRGAPGALLLVVTCRDEAGTTYNLSFEASLRGGDPELVAEQRTGAAAGEVPPEAVVTGITAEQALALCKTDFVDAAQALDEATLQSQQGLTAQAEGAGFVVRMPFTTRSDLGHAVSYEATCHASSGGDTRYDFVLQAAGALAICRDHLRSESILLGRATLLEDDFSAQPADSGFRFRMPFLIHKRAPEGILYSADCRVDDVGNSELTMHLQRDGAFTRCQQALRAETLLMKKVTLPETPAEEREAGEGFVFTLDFSADSPDGNRRRFRAHCRVDSDGDASVETELDQTAIASVCVSGVKQAASNMLAVKVLEESIPPLAEDGEGYLAVIPFDAEDPNGRTLHFQGDCRVDESGRTKVKIRPRNLP